MQMGGCCEKHKTKGPIVRCPPGEYPRDPTFKYDTHQPVGVTPLAGPVMLPPGSNHSQDQLLAGAAIGYLAGHGGMDMLTGIDGGPRVAVGGIYYGFT